jgi:hypothetical protein
MTSTIALTRAALTTGLKFMPGSQAICNSGSLATFSPRHCGVVELNARQAWAVLAAGVVGYEVACKDGQLLSEGVDEWLVSRPILTRAVIAALALHLGNALAERLTLSPLLSRHQKLSSRSFSWSTVRRPSLNRMRVGATVAVIVFCRYPWLPALRREPRKSAPLTPIHHRRQRSSMPACQLQPTSPACSRNTWRQNAFRAEDIASALDAR